MNNIFDYYIVKDKDTIFNIAKSYNIDSETLRYINGIDINYEVKKDQIITVPKDGIKIYITKEGNTLTDVAMKLNTNPNALLNNNKNIYLLPDEIVVSKS